MKDLVLDRWPEVLESMGEALERLRKTTEEKISLEAASTPAEAPSMSIGSIAFDDLGQTIREFHQCHERGGAIAAEVESNLAECEDAMQSWVRDMRELIARMAVGHDKN